MHRNAYILLLLATLFWGGNAVAGKLAIGHVSPMVLTSARWAFTLAILLVIGHRQLRADWTAIRPALPLLALLGAIGFTAFNILVYTALRHTTAINISIEHAAIPMVIFIANFLIFGTRVTALQIGGFLISAVGVAIVATHGEPTRIMALDLNVGDAMMLVAILVYSIYTVLLRYRPSVDWRSMMIVLSASALIASLPFVAWEIGTGTAQLHGMRGWTIVAYTVIFPSVLAQVFYMTGVAWIGANRTGLFMNLVPITGTLLSVLILGEAFAGYHALALVLAMGGIAIAEWSGRKAAG